MGEQFIILTAKETGIKFRINTRYLIRYEPYIDNKGKEYSYTEIFNSSIIVKETVSQIDDKIDSLGENK